MKHTPFRPEPFWQAALMTLPDNVFFDLMRSALGNIKTPFNKQKLMEDLCVFLSRPEIQKTISAFINEDDRRIIAAIALLGEPLPPELERFFAEDFSYTELHSLLLNLEERLIVYRFRDEKDIRIALNPRLEKVLTPIAQDSSRLFSSIAFDASGEQKKTAFDGRTLTAFFTFFLSGEIFRTDGNDAGGFGALLHGTFRKKILDEGARLFPGHDTELIAGALLTLGVLARDGGRLTTNGKKLAAFKELSHENRLVYFAAGIALQFQKHEPDSRFPADNSSGESILFPPLKYTSSLKYTARLIHDLLRFFDPGRLYPKAALFKRAEVIKKEETSHWTFPDELPETDRILAAMELSGLLACTGGKSFAGERTGTAMYRILRTGVETSPSPCVAFDSSFSFILYPDIAFTDALDLAIFSVVEETGTTVRFSLSRESVVRGFDRGGKAGDLWQLLDRLSGGRAGKSLKWNLEDWEKRYGEVALYEGVILTLGEGRAYLAESGPLARMVRKLIGPGVFLLGAEHREDAAEALRTAGVDILALPDSGPERNQAAYNSFHLPGDHAGGTSEPQTKPQEEYDEEKAEQIKETFRTTLADMKIGRQEQEEMLSRIGRRMIVSESQLKDVSIRYEKLEARSLDYVGKTAVAKQAVESGSLVEVNWPAGGGPLLGIPENLEKKGGETILVFKPRERQTEPVKIPLGKISYIRRIKQSIFGE